MQGSTNGLCSDFLEAEWGLEMHRLPFSFKSIIVVLAAMIAVGFYIGHKTKEARQTSLMQRTVPSETGI